MRILPLLVATACLPAAHAQALEPHQHGLARLEVTLDGNLLELRLQSPLDSLVGFESAPRTARQREAIAAMTARFQKPELLFVPTVEARCRPGEVRLKSPVLDPKLLAGGNGMPGAPAEVRQKAQPEPAHADPGPSKEQHGGADHADLDFAVSFSCAEPDALEGLQVLLFRSFPRLRQIDAFVVTAKGQRAARLAPRNDVLRW